MSHNKRPSDAPSPSPKRPRASATDARNWSKLRITACRSMLKKLPAPGSLVRERALRYIRNFLRGAHVDDIDDAKLLTVAVDRNDVEVAEIVIAAGGRMDSVRSIVPHGVCASTERFLEMAERSGSDLSLSAASLGSRLMTDVQPAKVFDLFKRMIALSSKVACSAIWNNFVARLSVRCKEALNAMYFSERKLFDFDAIAAAIHCAWLIHNEYEGPAEHMLYIYNAIALYSRILLVYFSRRNTYLRVLPSDMSMNLLARFLVRMPDPEVAGVKGWFIAEECIQPQEFFERLWHQVENPVCWTLRWH